MDGESSLEDGSLSRKSESSRWPEFSEFMMEVQELRPGVLLGVLGVVNLGNEKGEDQRGHAVNTAKHYRNWPIGAYKM